MSPLEVVIARCPGIELRFSDGSVLGCAEDARDARIAASNMGRFLERQLAPWPAELASFRTTEDRHELLQVWHRDGVEALPRDRVKPGLPLAQLLKPYILTQALGTSLDGSFTTLVPVGDAKPEELEIRSDSQQGVEFWRVSAVSFEKTARELIAWFKETA